MQESQTAQSNTGLIYGLNDRPLYERPFLLPYSICLLFCSHHHSASYHRWSIKTGFETTSFLVSMSLFASGISTFINADG